MDLDILADESLQSEGIFGTIYYSEIKIEPDWETSSYTNVSLQNDIEDRVIIRETDKDFQLQGRSTNANVNDVIPTETNKSFQLGENSLNTNVNVHLQGSNEVNAIECDKERRSGGNSVDSNTSPSQNNISENNATAALAEEYQLPMIKLTTLLKLRQKSKKEVIEFCIKSGLIASKFICPICENDMLLLSRDSMSDGYYWGCRNKSHKKISKSIRTGSFFATSRLRILDTLMIIHCWVYKLPRDWIWVELEIGKKTVGEWNDIFRDVCVEICARDYNKIGGKGAIVEIEGGEYERRKNDENIKKNSFVFIGTENMYGDKTFLRIVENCDKNSFLEVIKSSVLPGSTVISRFCSVFKCHKDWEFIDLAKSCKYKFKTLKSSDLSKRKNFWDVIRRKMPQHRKDYGFDHYIAEFLWRKRNYCAHDKMRRFLLHIKTIYPPPTFDEVFK